MMRLRLRMAALAALATATLAGLVVAGTGVLAVPPLRSWQAMTAWYDRIGAGAASMAGLRLATIVAVAWLLLGALLQLLASFSTGLGLRRFANALSPLALRRLAHGVAGLSITAGLTVPVLPEASGGDPPGTAVMEVVVDDAPTIASTTSTTGPRFAPPADPVLAPAPATMPAVPVPPLDEQVRVEAGDSFWSLAVDALTEGPSSPSDGEVLRYWERLIDANRDRLVDPTNPDLLFPDQVIALVERS